MAELEYRLGCLTVCLAALPIRGSNLAIQELCANGVLAPLVGIDLGDFLRFLGLLFPCHNMG